MKNTLKILGIIILTAAVMLSMTTCDEDDESAAFLGKTLKLSGPVWTMGYGEAGITWEKFTGTTTVSAYSYDSDTDKDISLGGSGKITSGQLTFEIGTPTNLELNSFGEFTENMMWTNVKISDNKVKTASFSLVTGDNANLVRSMYSYSGQKMVIEYVNYIYVDRDVTITGKGRTYTTTCTCDEDGEICHCDEYGDTCDCGGMNITSSNLNLNLKAGWNAITMNMTESASGEEVSITEGVGATRWILAADHYDDGDDD